MRGVVPAEHLAYKNHRIQGVKKVKVRNLELTAKIVNEHGRMDFLAGSPCDPSIPLKIYDGLTPEQQIVIMESWMNGWNDESVMQTLTAGMRA
jgi:hypothetical protein